MSLLNDMVDRGIAQIAMLNPQVKDNIARLDGKVLCIELTAPESTLYLVVENGALKLLRQTDHIANVVLSGTLISFLRFVAAGAAAQTFSNYQISIRGDMKTGQQFQDLFSQVDLDWEELLAQRTNDMVARRVGNCVRQTVDWGKETMILTEENIADYLQEEAQILPVREMANRVKQKTAMLRQDIDRLQTRVEKLQRRLETGA